MAKIKENKLSEEPKKRIRPYDSDVSARYRKYRNEYSKNKLRAYAFRLNRTTEEGQNIISYLDQKDNINEYLRDLVLADIKRQKAKEKRELKKLQQKRNQ